jgi:hypothetical protein
MHRLVPLVRAEETVDEPEQPRALGAGPRHTLGRGVLAGVLWRLAGFYSLRPAVVTEAGLVDRIRRLSLGTSAMAALTWLTVIVGTWVVYPWYRAKTPTSPKSLLLAHSNTKHWHEFAMEWKEHIAWIAPLLATTAAFMVLYYRADLIRNPLARRIAMSLFIGAFVCAVIAGLLGALITKKAPVS